MPKSFTRSVLAALMAASFASALSLAPVVRSPLRLARPVMSVREPQGIWPREPDIIPGTPSPFLKPGTQQQAGQPQQQLVNRERVKGNNAPKALPERVEALCGALNIPPAQNLVQTVDKAVETVGLQQELEALPLAQKVDACFQTISPTIAKVQALCMELNLTKSESLIETVDRAIEAIGLSQDVLVLPLPQKVEVCLQTIGTSRDASPTARAGPRGRRSGPYSSGYGYAGPYGGSGFYGYPYRGYYDNWGPGGYYGYYNFPGGRRARLYDRAVNNWYYDPYNAVGYSWDAWLDFFS